MKKILVVGAVLVVVSLLGISLSSAVVVRPSEPASEATLDQSPVWEAAERVLPASVAKQILTLAQDHPEVASAMTMRGSVGQLANGSNTSFLTKMWRVVFYYRLCRLLFSYGVFTEFPTKVMGVRVLHWAIQVLKWVQIGLLLGLIEVPQPPPVPPEISFVADDTNRTITVTAVNFSQPVNWSDISQVGNGTCDPLPNGTVDAGDMITNCSGWIILVYVPYSAWLYDHQFPE